MKKIVMRDRIIELWQEYGTNGIAFRVLDFKTLTWKRKVVTVVLMGCEPIIFKFNTSEDAQLFFGQSYTMIVSEYNKCFEEEDNSDVGSARA